MHTIYTDLFTFYMCLIYVYKFIGNSQLTKKFTISNAEVRESQMDKL